MLIGVRSIRGAKTNKQMFRVARCHTYSPSIAPQIITNYKRENSNFTLKKWPP